MEVYPKCPLYSDTKTQNLDVQLLLFIIYLTKDIFMPIGFNKKKSPYSDTSENQLKSSSDSICSNMQHRLDTGNLNLSSALIGGAVGVSLSQAATDVCLCLVSYHSRSL